MRVVVTGAGGLVGGRMAAVLHERRLDTLALYRHAPPPAGPRAVCCDLADAAAVERMLDAERPDAVVHAAALARVDRCHADPEAARRSNVELAARLAAACRERALRLVALSTDLVFSGTSAPLDEGDSPAPTSVYGETKLAGERAILAEYPRAAVARIALVAGRGHGPSGSASEQVAWALGAGRSVTLFEDEFRTPVDPGSLADAVARLLARESGGVFHLGGPERVSRLALGRRVARALGLSEAGIVAARQADVSAPEPRPADVSLDSSRARRELGWEPRPLDEAIRDGRRSPD